MFSNIVYAFVVGNFEVKNNSQIAELIRRLSRSKQTTKRAMQSGGVIIMDVVDCVRVTRMCQPVSMTVACRALSRRSPLAVTAVEPY